MLRTKDLITKLLDGLEVFLGVDVMSWNSSKLQMAGVRHIYSPPTQSSRCLFLCGHPLKRWGASVKPVTLDKIVVVGFSNTAATTLVTIG